MTFTQHCFIQLQHSVDVWFVIDKLNMLGYKPCIHQYGLQEGSESTYIICKSDGSYYFAYSISYYTNDWGINCIDNKELFIALAALRDDTPINSFYYYKERLCKCEKLELKDLNFNTARYYYKCRCIDNPMICFCCEEKDLHKATVEEIIEHFKNK